MIGIIFKRSLSIFTLFALLIACSREETVQHNISKEENMNIQVVEVSMKSKISDRTLILKLPECFFSKNAPIQNDRKSDEQLSTINLYYPRLAFSEDSTEKPEYKCPKMNDARLVTIDSLNPDSKRDFQKHIDTYFLDSRKEMGAFLLEQKNNIGIYRVGVGANGVFFNKDYPNLNHPMYIDFLAYNPKSPNSPFRYHFDIYTIIHNEYLLLYTVVATPSNPKQFAERFRQAIEKNQSILDFPEILDEFVSNNEKVTSYFEVHSLLKK